ncbi:MAG: zinc ABC transporter solute-binding protein [Gammaproteobacteria bacterium]|nr:zinc ABC transporter solute-binding protein [Gammaproteobacteria bacterium]NIW99663.1 zinc ABC transporter solute-binding protein [Phycisphaerae bacterium]
MKQIINRAPKEQVKAILSMPQHSSRPAEIVAESTGIPLYELDPLGGEQGRQSYADLLLFNTHILIKALQ